MVGKLMKHELRALFRILIWFMGGVLLLGILARLGLEVFMIAHPDGANIALVSLTLAIVLIALVWYISAIALNYAAVIVSLVRYFKSLFTGEGYLTFSLPATPTQLLISKFLAALIAQIASVAAVVLSVLIALPMGFWSQLIEENVLGNLWQGISSLIGSDPLVIVELVLLIIALIPSGILYLYFIASIGQLFTKARIAITIGLYYGISFVLGLGFTLFALPFVQLIPEPHILAWIAIVILYGFDIGSFFLIRAILLHKVNLVV